MTLKAKRLSNFFLLFLPSICFFYIGLFLTISLRYQQNFSPEQWSEHLSLFSVIFFFWIFVFYFFHLFDLCYHRSMQKFLVAFFTIIVLNTIIAIGIFYAQKNLLITPRRFLLIFQLITFSIIFFWMLSLRLLFQKRMQTPVIFLDLPQISKQFLETKPYHNSSFNSFTLPKKNPWIILPDIVHLTDTQFKKIKHYHQEGATIVSCYYFCEEYFRIIPLESVTEWWFLQNTQNSNLFSLALKRAVDFLFGVLIGIVFLSTFPLIALLIKFSDEGSIFFTQERLSLQGKPFILYKYRTMIKGTPTNTWTNPYDKRITSMGKFLRKTRLDELPQCFNLLNGTMSLVGPRPEQTHLSSALAKQIPFYDERYRIAPGLTGWSQLHMYASSAEESKKKLEYDLYYLKHRSFFFDVEIIIKTILYLFR